MDRRLVIGLRDSSAEQGVRSALSDLGVEDVAGPRADLPDVLVARLPNEDPEPYIHAVRAVDGVAYAELESLYEAFGE